MEGMKRAMKIGLGIVLFLLLAGGLLLLAIRTNGPAVLNGIDRLIWKLWQGYGMYAMIVGIPLLLFVLFLVLSVCFNPEAWESRGKRKKRLQKRHKAFLAEGESKQD